MREGFENVTSADRYVGGEIGGRGESAGRGRIRVGKRGGPREDADSRKNGERWTKRSRVG